MTAWKPAAERTRLRDGAKVVVVGAGPAGSFFAIELLRRVRARGRRVDLSILERKRVPCFYGSTVSPAFREGCNYCAGGISPRTCDVLESMGIVIPESVVQGRISSLVVEGHWKNLELRVPPGRTMLSVYRGSSPVSRPDRLQSFDAVLLEAARSEGADLLTGEVQALSREGTGRAVVRFCADRRPRELPADLVVLATGVNSVPGIGPAEGSLFRSLHGLLPGLELPRTRRSLIFEVQLPEDWFRHTGGEVHFIEWGSPGLRLEMCSVVPKHGYATVVLIGASVDQAKSGEEALALVHGFLALPQVKKLLPGRHQIACICRPNMVVGVARNALADGVAVVGDLATSRLYKDGIQSAYLTSRALARAVVEEGTDRESLQRAYWPVVLALARDNLFGRVVFLVHRIAFSTPVASRIAYQAVQTERKTRVHLDRRLGRMLWRIASGDAEYRDILVSMLHPRTLQAVLGGGLWVTVRNALAEAALGLSWKGFGRYPTGVYRESITAKREEFARLLGESGLELPGEPDLEKMFTVRMRASGDRVLAALGQFGDPARRFFRPRLVAVKRISGKPHQVGSVIAYDLPLKRFSFRIVVERNVKGRCVIHRILDGFARDGVLIFDVEPRESGGSSLSVYLGFDYARGEGLLDRLAWSTFRLLFPGFLHDVLWNHSLCQLKDVVESAGELARSPDPSPEGVRA